jgi:pyruvate dehydrogenase E1 component
LKDDWDVAADIWITPSFTELRREGLDVDHWNALHPDRNQRRPFVTRKLQECEGPVIAASDYMKAFTDQIRAFVPAPYYVLGTDGFGRSDTRERLRDFFEVDARWITVTALRGLADMDVIPRSTVSKAIKHYGIDPDKPNPATV